MPAIISVQLIVGNGRMYLHNFMLHSAQSSNESVCICVHAGLLDVDDVDGIGICLPEL